MFARRPLGGVALLLGLSITAYSATVEQSLSTEAQTNRAGQQSQKQVSKLDSETRELLQEYQRLLQQADYQKSYNQELKQLLQEQAQEMQSLQQQVADVQITRLHVMPLLRDMVAGLKQFIELDLPFETEARLASVKKLETLLASASVPLAEKFRRVMEAYQAESDYSYQLGSYSDKLLIDGSERAVELLRIGRSSLYFQTPDGKQSGYWNREQKAWQLLDNSYNRVIRQGIRLAAKQLPPQLITLPVAGKEVQ